MKKLLAFILTLTALLVPVLSLADTDVTIGVTGAFYEDLWQPTIDALESEGIHITLQQFSDFSIPNNALNDGSIQMNAFQHHAYFNNDTATNGYDLTVIGDTLIAPLTLYSEKYDSLDALKEAAGRIKQ